MTKELNGRQHAVIGALAGMTETCIQQPTIYIKSSIQVSWFNVLSMVFNQEKSNKNQSRGVRSLCIEE